MVSEILHRCRQALPVEGMIGAGIDNQLDRNALVLLSRNAPVVEAIVCDVEALFRNNDRAKDSV